MAQWICEECGCGFERPKSGNRPIRFCGVECYHSWQRRNPNKGIFKKKNKPWNKDMKGIHLSPKSEFKKGHISERQLPVGSVQLRTRNRPKNSTTTRAYIKIEDPDKWILRAHYVWQKKHGQIPKGLVLHHIDGDPLNDDLSNLSLVTRGNHAAIHGRWRNGLNGK